MKSEKKIRIKYISKVPDNDIGFEKVKIKRCLELENYPDGVWCLTNPHPTNVDLSLKKIYLKKVKVILKDKGKYYSLYGFPSSNYIRQGNKLTRMEYELLQKIPSKFLNKKALKCLENYYWDNYIKKESLRNRLFFHKFLKKKNNV